MRAATRVKSEQASIDVMLVPSRHEFGEGRRVHRSETDPMKVHSPAGVMDAARIQAAARDTGDLRAVQGVQSPSRGESSQESEGLIVPKKSANTDGGKEPWFGARLDETRGWRSA
jgi:hypothetical protein